jgi:putative FmdB family regulatory protein
MPVYQFECQECGEVQTLTTAALEFEVTPEPCAYCKGHAFNKLVGTVGMATAQTKERDRKIDALEQKVAAKAAPCHECGHSPGDEE